MTKLQIITSPEEAQLPIPWVDSPDFKGRNSICDVSGKLVEQNYSGRSYRLVAKKEYTFSCMQKGFRGFLGVVAIVMTLCLGLLFKVVRDLFTKQKDFLLLAVPHNAVAKRFEFEREISSHELEIEKTYKGDFAYVKDAFKEKLNAEDALSKEELEKDLEVPETVIPVLKKMVKAPCFKRGLEMLSDGNNYVFSIRSAPGLIFKFSRLEHSLQSRFRNMILAQTVCRIHQLGLLVIPQAKLIAVEVDGKLREIIVEKRLDVSPSIAQQEELIQQHNEKLDKAIGQLAKFIFETRYSDVKLSNNAVMNREIDECGNVKIGILDLEHREGVLNGLFGNFGILKRTGLVGCVANERQARIVESFAKENGLDVSKFNEVLKKRLAELETFRKLKEFHAAKEIVNGDEAISEDVDHLDFSAYPEPDKLKNLAKAVLKEANLRIAISDDPVVKVKRNIFIHTRNSFKYPEFYYTDRETITGCSQPKMNASDLSFDEAWDKYYETTALGVVFKKLRESGLIFNAKRFCSEGYFLQA
jgi:hypothetical protein